MIVKKRDIPIKIQKLEALYLRTAKAHHKKEIILEELNKRRSGYYGEQSFDYHLSFLDDKKYFIFHGLRLLSSRNHHFQIDTLITSPFFIVISEIKYFSGIITFDSRFHQLIQQNNDKEKGYQDPITQAKRHQLQLNEWLQQNKFPSIPIIPHVIISNPSTIIKSIGNFQRYPKVMKAANFIFEIQELEKLHKREYLTKKKLAKLSKLLLKKHTPEDYDALKNFTISKSEILTGVYCNSCSALPMKRVHGKWVCSACQVTSKTEHINALKDYALLISTTITKPELQHFLQLPSRMIATNIIKSMNLPSFGNGKARVYQLEQLLRK